MIFDQFIRAKFTTSRASLLDTGYHFSFKEKEFSYKESEIKLLSDPKIAQRRN